MGAYVLRCLCTQSISFDELYQGSIGRENELPRQESSECFRVFLKKVVYFEKLGPLDLMSTKRWTRGFTHLLFIEHVLFAPV